jgi:hypothetical protein
MGTNVRRAGLRPDENGARGASSLAGRRPAERNGSRTEDDDEPDGRSRAGRRHSLEVGKSGNRGPAHHPPHTRIPLDRPEGLDRREEHSRETARQEAYESRRRRDPLSSPIGLPGLKRGDRCSRRGLTMEVTRASRGLAGGGAEAAVWLERRAGGSRGGRARARTSDPGRSKSRLIRGPQAQRRVGPVAWPDASVSAYGGPRISTIGSPRHNGRPARHLRTWSGNAHRDTGSRTACPASTSRSTTSSSCSTIAIRRRSASATIDPGLAGVSIRDAAEDLATARAYRIVFWLRGLPVLRETIEQVVSRPLRGRARADSAGPAGDDGAGGQVALVLAVRPGLRAAVPRPGGRQSRPGHARDRTPGRSS